ncbi:tRNA modification GTPase trmE [Colletotrichum phormii]|uniref:tRNA modification GTPase trmE n=1 Tax=Colletotrichum phormii TaxID=359342 RepID=A0AAJ0A2T0_9PEZI|nr:tRNA modification GTPase trmE [Colletotrichum phormii]KAK1655419.1 tRNA modification GTPase trmE [Colletotrichum phormii]
MYALVRSTRSLGRNPPFTTPKCLSGRGYNSLRIRPLAFGSTALGPFHQRNTLQGTRPQSRFITSTSEVIFKEDTIYALSTAQGRAGIAVIRVSGPGCTAVYKGLCPNKALPKPRYASVRTLIDGQAGDEAPILDSNALVLYFPGPKTVTGEDVLELHVHGGPATVKAVLAAISRCASASESSVIRYAEPGEFTKRAFLNDRLDLAQVESLGDTLSADTEQQRRAAVRGSSGSLGRTYEAWREQLLLARGEIEALIDFSEDQHFDESPTELMGNVSALVAEMRHGIRVHEEGGQRSELLRNGIRIALLGPPNVGKSSLMNLVVGREASIVSMEAGTTRDVVEVSLDIRGYLCSFADTAGIRTRLAAGEGGGGDPSEPALGLVEEEGIRRAKQKASESDIIVVLAAVEPKPGPDGGFRINYDAETLQLASEAQACLIVVNKRDAVDAATFSSLLERFRNETASQVPNLHTTEIITISCREAEAQAKSPSSPANASASQKDPGAIHGLIDRLVESFAGMTALPVDQQDLLGVTARQAQLLEQCRGFLDDFTAVAHPEEGGDGEEPDIVLAAEHLRYAADSLAKITGRVEAGDVEEVLGVIFEK